MIFNTVLIGGGLPVQAKAIGDATSSVVGDKVLLIPTSDLISEEPAAMDTARAGTYSYNNWVRIMSNGGILENGAFEGFNGYCVSSNGYYGGYQKYTYDLVGDEISITGASIATYNNAELTGIAVDYRDSFHFAYDYVVASNASSSFQTQRVDALHHVGRVVNGAFVSIGTFPMDSTGSSTYATPPNLGYVDGHLFLRDYYGSIDDNGVAWYQLGSAAYNGKGCSIPVKYNNTWYAAMFKGTGSSGSSYYVGEYYPWGTTSTSDSYPAGGTYILCGDQYIMSTFSSIPKVHYMDDDTDYLIIGSRYTQDYLERYGVYKLEKGPSTWKLVNLPAATAVLQSCLMYAMTWWTGARALDWFSICCKDRGDTVEMTIADGGAAFQNYVAHLVFDKTTETLTRLPDIFTAEEIADAGTNMNRYGSMQTNWDLNLVGLMVQTDAASGQRYYNCLLKHISDSRRIYQYNAYTTDKSNYYPDALTGFVKAVEVKAIGDTVLTVDTVEPTGTFWDNRGVLYGMEIIINGDF